MTTSATLDLGKNCPHNINVSVMHNFNPLFFALHNFNLVPRVHSIALVKCQIMSDANAN